MYSFVLMGTADTDRNNLHKQHFLSALCHKSFVCSMHGPAVILF